MVRILPDDQCHLPCLLFYKRLSNSDPTYTHCWGAGMPTTASAPGVAPTRTLESYCRATLPLACHKRSYPAPSWGAVLPACQPGEKHTPFPPFSSKFLPFRFVHLKVTWKAHLSFFNGLCKDFPSPTAWEEDRWNSQRISSSRQDWVSVCPSHMPQASTSGIFPKGMANGNGLLLSCAKMDHLVLV